MCWHCEKHILVSALLYTYSIERMNMKDLNLNSNGKSKKYPMILNRKYLYAIAIGLLKCQNESHITLSLEDMKLNIQGEND